MSDIGDINRDAFYAKRGELVDAGAGGGEANVHAWHEAAITVLVNRTVPNTERDAVVKAAEAWQVAHTSKYLGRSQIDRDREYAADSVLFMAVTALQTAKRRGG